jgi:hypothetical protein
VNAHPWSLVAPWYRWQRQPGVASRDTRPALQKYETPGFMDLFHANPQHSLRFTGEDAVAGRRKLYLAQHKRFYLVVCELHCDRPGFPNAGTAEVCEAGFVLRRRRVPLAGELELEAARLLQGIGARRARAAALERRRCVPCSGGGAVAVAQARRAVQRADRAQERVDELHAELARFAVAHELTPVLEGWTPSELDGVGTWSRIDGDAPEAGEEQVFGLFELIPDPRARPHAARGRALYFGLVPTATSDTLPSGSPRLDDRTAYEIQCFVRRHDARCPRTRGRGRDCHGELTWSVPTEPFTLASAHDLVGTANRPVTVAMPHLPSLIAEAGALAPGAGAGLRMAAPDASSLPVVVDDDGNPSSGSPGAAEVTSFAIPLITIVANFVMRMFIPIVVFLFGLQPLLRLRSSAPPSADAGVDLAGELATAGGGAAGTPPGVVIASPNSALAPLIWEDELPIPELEEAA